MKRVRAQLFASRRRVFARHWALHSALLSRAVSRVDARGMQPRLAEDARGCARFVEPRASQLQRSSGSMHSRARASACTILHEWLSQPRAHHGYDLDPAARRCIAPWRGPRVARNSALVKNSPPAGKRNREIEISASAMLVPLFFFPPLSLSLPFSLCLFTTADAVKGYGLTLVV